MVLLICAVMTFSENKRVNAFLDDLLVVSPKQLDIVLAIRELFLSTDSNLAEDIKYNGLVFIQSNKLVGGIFPYKAHISIEFSQGTRLSDPSGILEGKGEKRRHLKIIEKQDITRKNVRSFIKETVNL